MVETVSAQPLPANTQGGTAPQALEPGTELRAKVEANLPGGVVRLVVRRQIDRSSRAVSLAGRKQCHALGFRHPATARCCSDARQQCCETWNACAAAKHRSIGRAPAHSGKSANSGNPTGCICAAASGKSSGAATNTTTNATAAATTGAADWPAAAATSASTNRAAGRTAAARQQPAGQPTLPRPAPVLAQFLQATGVLPQPAQPGGAVQPQLPGQILTQPAAPGQPAVPNQAQVPGQLPAGSVLPQPAQPATPSGSGQAPLPAQGAGTGGPVAGAPIISAGQGTVVPPLPSGGPAPGTPGAPVSAQSGPQTTVTLPSGTGGPIPSQGAGAPLPGGPVSGAQVAGQQVSGPQASGPLQAGATSPTQVPAGGSTLAAAQAGTPLPAAGGAPLQSPGTGPIPTAPVTPQTGQPLPAGLPAGAPTGTGAPGVPPALGQPAAGQAIPQTGASPTSVTSASAQTLPAQGAPGAAAGAQASVAPPASALSPQGAPPGGVISQTVSAAGQGGCCWNRSRSTSRRGWAAGRGAAGRAGFASARSQSDCCDCSAKFYARIWDSGAERQCSSRPPSAGQRQCAIAGTGLCFRKTGMATPGQPAIASQGSGPAASTPVQQAAAALRQPLAEQQASLGNLFAQIGSLMSAQAAGKASVPDAVQKAMQQILGLRLNSGQPVTGQSLQQAVRLSGQGGEGRLPLPAGAQQSPVPDLKTALLAFRGLLQSLGAEPAMSVSSTPASSRLPLIWSPRPGPANLKWLLGRVRAAKPAVAASGNRRCIGAHASHSIDQRRSCRR
jgi:hypothetical protein